jgi:hypothetical protein
MQIADDQVAIDQRDAVRSRRLASQKLVIPYGVLTDRLYPRLAGVLTLDKGQISIVVSA